MATDGTQIGDTPYEPVQAFDLWMGVSAETIDIDKKVSRLAASIAQASDTDVAEVMRRMLREAAITTGAVEELYELAVGQTRTIAVGIDDWAQPLLLQGADKLQTFQDQVNAYEYALSLSHSQDPMTELLLRELHSIACQHQETYTAYRQDPRSLASVPHQVRLPRGEYKNSPNHVKRRDGSTLEYCPVLDTPNEVHRFTEQLQSDTFNHSHPLLKATYAHYGLVHIHPFADGNGRVARVLSSYYLFEHYFVPLIVYPDRRMTYFQALDAARLGPREHTLAYVIDRVTESVSRAQQELESLVQESVADEITQLRSALSSASEVSIEAAEELATKLLGEFASEVQKLLADASEDLSGALEQTVTVQQYGHGATGYLDPGYRVTNNAYATISLSRPAKLTVQRELCVSVAEDLTSRFIFRIATRRVTTGYFNSEIYHPVDVRFEDVNPTLSEGARPRLKLAAEAVVKSMLRDLNGDLAATLRQSGHGEP